MSLKFVQNLFIYIVIHFAYIQFNFLDDPAELQSG